MSELESTNSPAAELTFSRFLRVLINVIAVAAVILAALATATQPRSTSQLQSPALLNDHSSKA